MVRDIQPNRDKSCLVCGRQDKAKPMAFRGELWCSDRHRKVIKGEVLPTRAEMSSMDDVLYRKLDDHWEGTMRTRLKTDPIDLGFD